MVQPGRGCWRLEAADRFAVLVDGEDYYRALAESFSRAERSIVLIGWDVNSRTRLVRDESPGELPQELGPLLDALVERRRRLRAWILDWDYPMIYSLDREILPRLKLGWNTHRRVSFRLDSSHPIAGSQHQKIAVIDDKIAFVGGMDVSHGRWDTCEHRPEDPRRIDPWGRAYEPYHDVQVVFDGAAAAAVAALARERWRRATRRRLRAVSTSGDPWPTCVEPLLDGVDIAVARTEPAFAECQEVREIETAYLELIARARRTIYVENQYLTSAAIGEAFIERLARPDCPSIIIITPHACTGWLEQATMGVLRRRLLERMRKADRNGRLHVYCPRAAPDLDVKVHAKLMIVDDDVLTVGSANLNNRSMGLDSECNVIVEARGRTDIETAFAELRRRLVAEHLAVSPDRLASSEQAHGSLVGAIEQLRGADHTLVPLETEISPWIDAVVPDGVDPDRPVRMEDLMEPPMFADSGSPSRAMSRMRLALLVVATIVASGMAAALITRLRAVLGNPTSYDWTRSNASSVVAHRRSLRRQADKGTDSS